MSRRITSRSIRPLGSMALCSCLCIVCLLTFGSASDVGDDDDQAQCDLYLAPSSTSEKGQVRLGIYAGRKYEASTPIGNPEIAIQLADLEAHTDRKKAIEQKEPNYFGVASEMLWTPDSTGAKYDTDEAVGGPGRLYTAIPGVGMLGNFHAALINADWHENSTLFRTVMEDSDGGMGVVHPGRGAVSTYYNITIAATQTIPPGMEIFLNFGQDWSAKALEKNPMATRIDYERADQSVDRIIDFFNKHDESLSSETTRDMYDFLRRDVVKFVSKDDKHAAMMRSLMPDAPEKLQTFKGNGGSLRHKNPDVFRDLSWLRENGRCLDNLRAGPSTIPHAGRGAFATKTFAEGDVIAPVPLLHIGHRKELDMYALRKQRDEDGEERYVRKDGENAKPISSQLLINYSFGHSKSNMILYPFGTSFNFINHAPGEQANAKIVWSNSTDGMHNPDWLEVDPDSLSDDKYKRIGLMFDVVATKSIAEGAEVWIDYGDDWQKAWKKHVERVKKADIESDSWSPTALELNTIYHKHESGSGFSKQFKMPDELKDDPYPTRVTTACATQMKDIPENDPQRDIDGIKVFDWSSDRLVWQGISMRLCDVIDRVEIKDVNGSTEAVSYNYTVKVQLEFDSDISTESRIVRNVPHLAVSFVDRPYSSDQTRRDPPFEPFRHVIGIPDDILPSGWKHKRVKKTARRTLVDVKDEAAEEGK